MRANGSGCSHVGGMMFARRWRLRRMASQRGREARRGGTRASMGPWRWLALEGSDRAVVRRRLLLVVRGLLGAGEAQL